MKLKISTKIYDALIVQELSTEVYDIQQTFWTLMVDTREQEIIDALVKLGWTPPSEVPHGGLVPGSVHVASTKE